jgi:pyridoxal phosphate enzyme (YggS family)
MNLIEENIAKIKSRIKKASNDAGRNPNEIKLLLATKTVEPQNILCALSTGVNLIGENKAQELKNKFEKLQNTPHQTHFIGHLQTNKIKKVIKYVDCIQSVDSFKLAEKIQSRLELENKTIDIFIQINTSFEESKFGISPSLAIILAESIRRLDRLNIKGLMTIGTFSAEKEKTRKCFQLLKQLQLQLLDKNIPVEELSMGMSNDLEIAIEEGATIIRVGTAIFGKRPYPDSFYWNEKK